MHGARQDPTREEDFPVPMTAYGVFDDEGLQAQVCILSHHVYMGPEVVLPMGGIAGVACLPAARGHGYVRAAMIRALEHMREQGQPVSTLFPFSFDFYRQLGWEWVGVERRYSVPSSVLRSSSHTDQCRPARPSDREAIVETYRRFSRGYRGMVERTEKLWSRLLDDAPDRYTSTYVYEGSEGLEGYLTFRGGNGECTDLNEFICLTPAAREGLLGLLRRMNMQTRRFAWSAPDDDGLWYTLCHHGVETRIAPVTQARVVDVQAALSAWKPFLPGEGSFTLQVHDEQAPWNNGVWQVRFEEGQVEVASTDGEPDVAADIQALTQLYFGSASGYALEEAGRLSITNPASRDPLNTLFGGPIMWMNDHF